MSTDLKNFSTGRLSGKFAITVCIKTGYHFNELGN